MQHTGGPLNSNEAGAGMDIAHLERDAGQFGVKKCPPRPEKRYAETMNV